MYWLRTWGQILLPLFLSLVLFQLLMSFSENGISQIARHRSKLRTNSVEDGCQLKRNCQLCIKDKKCFWCNERLVCKKFCFLNLGCQISSSFWLNCKVDMFGFLMLLLIAVLLIVFIWHCFIFHYYLREYVHFILSKNALWNNIIEESTELVLGKCLTFFI
ncbi:hypothetical protein mRhiFer1_008760 [Rhinolophus ferrumequinum]|uniref:PTTG1 interacting protein n=1 Tax=Rhinolophus ferrumequinum TaxID=59479 RepID=A0A7J7TM10_RHIFE|nr:hypothetical protein mRhiFer1_008760 [Rhinolophus ferrumequinum]